MTRVSPQLSVDAAEHFYSESGLHGSSARTLARKIGITLGAIIRHFGSKEDIVLEINRRYAIPINAERNAMLDAALKRSGGSPLPLKDIVAA
jgi:AcrR family transcriptional regulator